MKYWKASESDYHSSVYFRASSQNDAERMLQRFKVMHGVYNKYTLTRVGWFTGMKVFSGLPKTHDATWTEFMGGTDFSTRSGAYNDFFVNESEPIRLGSMRNFHPLLGSERYRKEPYAGWEIAKECCTPEEVISIFNAYLVRAFSKRNPIPQLRGTTWEEVEESAKDPQDTIDGCLSFPALPDFYVLLARRTGKTIAIGNRSLSDSAGVFHSVSESLYHPDGRTKHIDKSPSDEEFPF